MIDIPVPFQTFNDLSEFLDGRRVTEELADVAGRAISDWIAKQNTALTNDGDVLKGGYQWKSLFLPSGTRIRIAIRRKIFHATVDGDHIHHNGAEVSPAQLVNQLAGCTRNAWKHVWLLLPGETRWQLAETMRT
ncbi:MULTISPECIES: hypothetical protein [unclassified Duganella]|uniref:hypothetical protein n=1 Tax=unclassified Duganella TaxID=2636909 RepID=UPI0006FD3D16|nr:MULTISPECIES: hypothetical protein [unclassified Duganella]KQV53740.1 hypothetical protein ASD07_04075 [Duganella sp. Root336D2]